jgi:ribosomal protein S18 acetylase RimI-like enzyme
LALASYDINIRNIHKNDISKIIDLQEESFSDMAAYGMIWPYSYIESHIHVFPEGQFCAEIVHGWDKRKRTRSKGTRRKGRIVASASSLIVTLHPDEYAEHTWYDITGYGMFTNHNPHGDTLYGADISTHPDFRRQGIATMLYNARKELAIKLGLRRIIIGGRLYNYYKYADKLTAFKYVKNVIKGKIIDPVILFQLKNGFRFIKILPDYLYDRRSYNYAAFMEWLNPHHYYYYSKKNN